MSGTGVAYPADAVSGSPTYAAIQGRNAFSALMAGATSSRPLGGITGVRPGTPTNTITATSTTWTMNPNGFAGYIDLETSATNSGYFFAFSGTITGPVTAAGGSARTDIVWVQIADSNTSDGSSGAPRVIIDYTANTTTPPSRAFVIAQVNVPASGGGSPTVTWVAPYLASAGGVIQVGTASQLGAALPALARAVALDTGVPYFSDGSAWQVERPETFDVFASGSIANGVSIKTLALGAWALPSVIDIDLIAQIGNSGSAGLTAAITLTSSAGTLTVPTINPVSMAASGGWYTFALGARLVLAAGTAATLTLTSSGAGIFNGMIRTRRHA